MPGKQNLIDRIKEGPCFFDGAMGSMLIAQGLAPGSAPEEWNQSHADVVYGIHMLYLEAGADVITTNTFGGTPSRLAGHGLAGREEELNNAGIRLARKAIEDYEAEGAGGKEKHKG
jgi:5-methyltetrahydrofolate--homocysteine methyltransferase